MSHLNRVVRVVEPSRGTERILVRADSIISAMSTLVPCARRAMDFRGIGCRHCPDCGRRKNSCPFCGYGGEGREACVSTTLIVADTFLTFSRVFGDLEAWLG